MSWKRMNGRQRSRYLIGEAILRHVFGDTMTSEHEAEVNTITRCCAYGSAVTSSAM